MHRPHRGSRQGFTSGVKSMLCAMPPWLKSARASTPITAPTARHRLRLKLAPSARPVGKDVGQPVDAKLSGVGGAAAPQPLSTPCSASP